MPVPPFDAPDDLNDSPDILASPELAVAMMETIAAHPRDEGVVFTCTPVSTAWVYFGPDYAKHPSIEMAARELKITLDCDDPPMFRTDPTKRQWRKELTAQFDALAASIEW